MDFKDIWTTLLNLDWFYMLDLALKNTRITLLDLEWFYNILDLDLDWHWAWISQWAKQEGRYKSMKTFLNFCFLTLNIALIHAVLIAPSFDNLCLGCIPSCSRRVGDSRWWGSLIMVPAGNKAKRFSSVNHTLQKLIIIISLHITMLLYSTLGIACHCRKFQSRI